MFRFLFALYLSGLVFYSGAQDLSCYCPPAPAESLSDTPSVYIHLGSNHFLKNNEYFNPVESGITWLGTALNPYLELAVNSRFSLNAGWYGLLYPSRSAFSVSVPFLNARWHFLPGWSLTMGSIRGYQCHRLPEPLYSFDQRYYRPPENGIQITADKKHHVTDIWLNWENFILPGDAVKEEFVMGGRSFLFLLDTGSTLNLVMTLNGLAAHKGGQLGGGGHMSTLMNSATGLMICLNPTGGIIDSAGLRSDFMGYRDVSPVKKQLYSLGWGSYTTVFAKTKQWTVEAGYWYGRHFIAPRGEWLFQSVSNQYVVYWEPVTPMITGRLSWQCPITRYITAGGGGGIYYDLKRQSADFYYHFQLALHVKGLVKKMPRLIF